MKEIWLRRESMLDIIALDHLSISSNILFFSRQLESGLKYLLDDPDRYNRPSKNIVDVNVKKNKFILV